MSVRDYEQSDKESEEGPLRPVKLATLEPMVITITSESFDEPLPVVVYGELALIGEDGDGGFTPTGVDRFVLRGHLSDQVADERAVANLRIVSLNGPLNDPKFEPVEGEQPGWVSETVECHLYYSRLSLLEPAWVEEDAVYMPLVRVQARLVVSHNPDSRPERPILDLSEMVFERVEGDALVSTVTVPAMSQVFAGPGRLPVRYVPKNSLQSNCNPQPLLRPCASWQYNTLLREVPLQFVNLTSLDMFIPAQKTALEQLCQSQIDEVCQIWGQKGALHLKVAGEIVDATGQAADGSSPKDIYRECNEEEFSEMGALNYHTADFVTVYVVEKLLDDPGTAQPNLSGGGITHRAEAGSFIVLAMDKMAGNPLLLAHELSHILGLAHPGSVCSETHIVKVGSANSIAQWGNPTNLATNTLENCQVFTHFCGYTDSNNQQQFKRVLPTSLVTYKKNANNNYIPTCFDPD